MSAPSACPSCSLSWTPCLPPTASRRRSRRPLDYSPTRTGSLPRTGPGRDVPSRSRRVGVTTVEVPDSVTLMTPPQEPRSSVSYPFPNDNLLHPSPHCPVSTSPTTSPSSFSSHGPLRSGVSPETGLTGRPTLRRYVLPLLPSIRPGKLTLVSLYEFSVTPPAPSGCVPVPVDVLGRSFRGLLPTRPSVLLGVSRTVPRPRGSSSGLYFRLYIGD